jgi:hypothetical protein
MCLDKLGGLTFVMVFLRSAFCFYIMNFIKFGSIKRLIKTYFKFLLETIVAGVVSGPNWGAIYGIRATGLCFQQQVSRKEFRKVLELR